MAIHYRTKAIFLKKQKKGEADFLFTIYTKDFGKLEILGKAIRKIKSKLRAGAREFCLSEIEFIQGKTYKTLTDSISIEEFKNIKSDLEKIKITYQIAEILDNLVGGQEKDEKIWNLLNETLQKLNNYRLPTTDYRLLHYYFLWNLLVISGYQPRLYNCVLCERELKPEKLYWSSEEGGVICQSCFDKPTHQHIGEGVKRTEKSETLETDDDIVKIIRILLKKDWQTIDRLKLSPHHFKDLKAISDDYLSYIS